MVVVNTVFLILVYICFFSRAQNYCWNFVGLAFMCFLVAEAKSKCYMVIAHGEFVFGICAWRECARWFINQLLRCVLINAQGCLDAEKTRLLIICADFGCVDDSYACVWMRRKLFARLITCLSFILIKTELFCICFLSFIFLVHIRRVLALVWGYLQNFTAHGFEW